MIQKLDLIKPKFIQLNLIKKSFKRYARMTHISILSHILVFSVFIFDGVDALQMKEMILDERLSFKISLYDLNRIEVRGDRIYQVFGNGGSFMVDHDQERGHLYLKPTPSNESRPISLTLTTEKGVVQDLSLLPVSMPGDTILLKQGERKERLDQEAILTLMKDLVRGQVQKCYTVDPLVEEVLLWENVETKRIITYRDRTLQGEVITFKNKGDKPLYLHERHFRESIGGHHSLSSSALNESFSHSSLGAVFKDPSSRNTVVPQVLAIGLEKTRVDPLETIRVYRILKRNGSSRIHKGPGVLNDLKEPLRSEGWALGTLKGGRE